MGEIRTGGHRSASCGASDWLHLAATPTFMLMAVLTAVGADTMNMLCSATQGLLSLGGMTTMYLLMAIFHAAPWLRLAFVRNVDAVRSNCERGERGQALHHR